MQITRERERNGTGVDGKVGSRVYWLCQLLGWGGYGLIYFGVVLVPLHQAGWRQVVSDAAYCAAGLGGTHLLRGVMQQQRWLQREARTLLLRLTGASVFLGTVQAVVLDAFLVMFRLIEGRDVAQLPAALAITTFFSAILIGLWLAIYFVVVSARSRRRAEMDRLSAEVILQETQLKALRQQLNPHFLFNCLNSIRSMIEEDPARAREMLTRLADLLRYALQTGEQGIVTFAEELKVVDDYLALESVRLEERLILEKSIEEAALATLFPAMMLQGMVENAIKHGIAQLPSGGRLAIEARCDHDQLVVTVENTGQLSAAARQGGIGLKNALARLQLLYQNRAGIEMYESEMASVVVRLWLPMGQNPARSGDGCQR